MEDARIIELYSARSEQAISETAAKYGAYLNTIAYNVLRDAFDAEECVADSYMRVWNAIPPAKPSVLKTFIGKITRNLALDRYEKRYAQKRGMGEVELCLDELSEVLASTEPELAIINGEITEYINEFLEELDSQTRRMFVRRYWYMDSIREIANSFGCGESKVKTTLYRLRENLRRHLQSKGVNI